MSMALALNFVDREVVDLKRRRWLKDCKIRTFSWKTRGVCPTNPGKHSEDLTKL